MEKNLRRLIKTVIKNINLLNHLYEVRLNKIRKAEKELLQKKVDEWGSVFGQNSDKILFELDHGIKIYLYKDSVLCRLIYEGNFETQEIKYLKNSLQKGDIFLDIGSNIGLYSLIASSMVGPEGNVIAFEPSPNTFKRLIHNCELALYKNIICKNIGLSNISATLPLNISNSGYDAWDSFIEKSNSNTNERIEVQVTTLDEEIEFINKEKVKFIKIDVEGFEKNVLLGGIKYLREYSPIIMIEFNEKNIHYAGYTSTEVYDLLNSWGYKWLRFHKNKLVYANRNRRYEDENLIAIKKDNIYF